MAERASWPGTGLNRRIESRRSGEAGPRRVVERVERLVLTALPVRLSEAFLAGSVRLNIKELNRMFVMVRGVDLQAGLRNARLDELKRRLDADAGLPPKVAALQCGFGCLNIAQQFFKARFGVSLMEVNTAPRRRDFRLEHGLSADELTTGRG